MNFNVFEIRKFKIKQQQLINGIGFKNDSPILLPKKLKKNSKVGNINISDESTMNTISPSENNHKDSKENIDNFELLSKKINNAFESLEKLIIDDDSNNINEETLIINNNSNNYLNDKNVIKNNDIIDKKNRKISIPKLNFSEILDEYIKTPINIKEINIGIGRKKEFLY